MKDTFKQTWRGALFGALLAAACGLLLLKSDFQISEKLLHLSYNIPFLHRPIIEPHEVVMVYMDDDSHRELQQPYDRPWDRGVHARLVERLTVDGAKAVVFDVIFSGPNADHPDGDQRFARAIAANGHVVLGAEYGLDGDNHPTMYPPYDPFFNAAAAVGFVELNPDNDFIVRRHLHAPPDKAGDSYSSFTWETAKMLGAPVTKGPDTRYAERWINYYGPPGTIPSVSYYKALDTNQVPPGAFSNVVVFVGSSLKTEYSGQFKDQYFTPYSKSVLVPAVEVQATQFLNLLRGDWLTQMPRTDETLVILLIGLLAGFGLTLFRSVPAAVLTACAMTAITLAVFFCFGHYRLWFPWLIVVAVQIPVALLWSVVFNSIRLYVQNKLYEASLALYLSPKLVKKFSSDKDLLKPGAKKGTLTILFSDIASFTSISEGMDSDELAHHMNSYFETAVGQCIHHTDGTIVKYIGDAIFAFWNAPDPQADHQVRACEAALQFRNLPPQHMNGQLLVTRIGLHTGVANVGNFGSTTRVDYTALGENINLASRMEGLNKYLGTTVLLTTETHAGIGNRFTTRFLGQFRLKGFEKAVDVYELLGDAKEPAKYQSLLESFSTALKLFQAGKLDEAEVAFRAVLQVAPDDGPAKFYLKQFAVLREHPLPGDWAGEIELKEK
ncbi:MAG TPA: adenylate/guanylate cyclase domain-containing protein [Verrucomicrobiae bacterium]